MSERNVELIRRWIDAWNRADFDGFCSFFDSSAELITDPSWPESGLFEGRDAIRAWYEGIRETWAERTQVVLTEIRGSGNIVVARIDWRVRGRISGIDTDLDATCVSTVEGRKITRLQWYFDHTAALRAAGLSE